MSLPPTIVVTFSPDLRSIGVRLGMMLAISGIGSLIGGPIAGALLGKSKGWMWLQIWCASLFVVSFLFSLATRLLVHKPLDQWRRPRLEQHGGTETETTVEVK